ncbi:MBL fold metallo-hydrolase [Nioella aestuarii]|uniref:MBL fold metallo-hydrolase n=1 Tax=Nioella aestuarii TaxID=1662864 RepID=UPI003D7F3335
MRLLLRRALAAAAILLSSAALASAQEGYVHELAPNFYSFGQGNAHSMFMVTDEGVAVFETFNTGHSQAMLAAIREVTDLPIRYAFHTHNHWDHSSGGQVFLDEGAQTVMHRFADEYLEANPGPDTTRASVVWEGEQTEFTLGSGFITRT